MRNICPFKVPDEKLRSVAIGGIAGAPIKIKKALQCIIPLGLPIEVPVEGEWLWEHDEDGQIYDSYKSQSINRPDDNRNTIYIQPLEADITNDFLEKLKILTEAFYYGLKVKIRPVINIEKSSVESRINDYTNNKQYHAGKILRMLQDKLPKDAYCMIGICSKNDLYPRDEWNFVFGMASIKDRTGVFSFARYDENFYYKTNKETDPELLFYRSSKVMLHEIGHMFGLRHCIYFECYMNGSNHLEENDKRIFHACPVCIRKLQYNINFSFLERYQKLADVCKNLGSRFKDIAEYNQKVADLIKEAYGSHYSQTKAITKEQYDKSINKVYELEVFDSSYHDQDYHTKNNLLMLNNLWSFQPNDFIIFEFLSNKVISHQQERREANSYFK